MKWTGGVREDSCRKQHLSRVMKFRQNVSRQRSVQKEEYSEGKKQNQQRHRGTKRLSVLMEASLIKVGHK